MVKSRLNDNDVIIDFVINKKKRYIKFINISKID